MVKFLKDPKITYLNRDDISAGDYKKFLESSAQDQKKIDFLLQRKQDVEEAIQILTHVN
jgi:hypothetical protein